MEIVLLVVHLLIALALIGMVLLQPSEGGALGVGQGPGGLSGMMQGRSAASSLTRTTVWLGVAFFVTSISLTLLAKANRQVNPLAPITQPGGPLVPTGPSSIPIPDGGLLAPQPQPDATAPATPAPAAPATPAPATPAPAASTPPATVPPAAAAPAPPVPPPATP